MSDWNAVMADVERKVDVLGKADVRLVERLPEDRRPPAVALSRLVPRAFRLTVLRPDDAKTLCKALAPYLPAAIDQVSEGSPPDGALATRMLALLNVMACNGLPVLPEWEEAGRAWLAAVPVRFGGPQRRNTFQLGVAALALGVPERVRDTLREKGDGPVPFAAGETHGFGREALLRHLAGAVDAGAGFAEVEPAWRDFLAHLPTPYQKLELDFDDVLWVARVVRHHVGGESLGGVGPWVARTVAELQ